MATIRSHAPLPVGSMQWINDENAQVERHCDQEVEDFSFSARNELEWLNEHMADIFAKENINVAEIFKTPGKLRGKTPRTARKRDPLQTRVPLSDIFSSNVEPCPPPVFGLQGQSPEKLVAAIKIAQDVVEAPILRLQKKVNTDSGYHGLSEDEMEVDPPKPTADASGTATLRQKSPLRPQLDIVDGSEDRSTTERSFHSAREEITKTQVLTNVPQSNESLDTAIAKEDPISVEPVQSIETEVVEKNIVEDHIADESRSPSQGSSPERPLIRKSSLTFAALPARPPLTTKKSFGARNSRTSHLDQSNFLERFTGGKSLGGAKPSDTVERKVDVDDQVHTNQPGKATQLREESDPETKLAKLHNKSSTQRLHERIHLLGKSQTARPTKSIHAIVSGTQPSGPHLPDSETIPQKPQQAPNEQNPEDDDDEWIQPPKPMSRPISRPPLSKSTSADVMEGIRGKQTIGDHDFHLQGRDRSVSKPESPRPHTAKIVDLRTASDSRAASPGIYSAYDGVKTFGDAETMDALHDRALETSTTPYGSPSAKRYVDGPLNASKSKLQSIMKTAKGLFSSSAGVSAKAKIDLLSSGDEQAGESSNWTALRSSVSTTVNMPLASSTEEPQMMKTRSSTEKEQRKIVQAASTRETKQQRDNQSHEPLAHTKGGKAIATTGSSHTGQSSAQPSRTSPRKAQNNKILDVPEHSSQSMGLSTSHNPDRPQQPQRSKDPRRPIKPVKDSGPKPKPQPVAIRVGTLSATQRMPLNNAALSSNLQESLPSAQPKQAVVAKKPSLQPSASNSNLKGSVNGAAKPRALIVAERKKEQDEKEAQRKREQKAEMDRRRAAQQEEARRQEQLSRLEAERQRERDRSAAVEDPKHLAQKHAIEVRRMELQKKEQQRLAANHPTTTNTTRPDPGRSRPPSRQQNAPEHHSRPINTHHAPNPSKAPIKRIFEPENEEASARPKPQAGPSYQQNEAKRRRTEDEDAEEFPMRPTHAPPVRQSAIRKDGPKPSVFTNNHTQAPPPASHHTTGQSLLKATTQNQAYQQHTQPQQISRPGNYPDMKQFANNKIPFADAPNPPAHHHQQQQHHHQPQLPQSQPHKTPYQSTKFPQPPTAPQTSPPNPNRENNPPHPHPPNPPPPPNPPRNTRTAKTSTSTTSPPTANPTPPRPTTTTTNPNPPTSRTGPKAPTSTTCSCTRKKTSTRTSSSAPSRARTWRRCSASATIASAAAPAVRTGRVRTA